MNVCRHTLLLELSLGEIDIMEQINGGPAWYGTYHWNGHVRPSPAGGRSETAVHGEAERQQLGAHPVHSADPRADQGRCSVVSGQGGHGEVQRCVALQHWDERYHEFAVEWDGRSFVSFYLNAVLVGTVRAGVTTPTRTPEGMAEGGASMPVFHDDPMFLMLQTAVGGPWPGEPIAATALPAYHMIDYVRYEARPHTSHKK